MISFIGSILGPVVDIDFGESSTRVDFVRVKVNLRFQRNFKFGEDENVVLKFWYERLRNFCNKCGLLTHEAKDCPLNFDDNDEDPQDPDEKNDGNEDQPQFDVGNIHKDIV